MEYLRYIIIGIAILVYIARFIKKFQKGESGQGKNTPPPATGTTTAPRKINIDELLEQVLVEKKGPETIAKSRTSGRPENSFDEDEFYKQRNHSLEGTSLEKTERMVRKRVTTKSVPQATTPSKPEVEEEDEFQRSRNYRLLSPDNEYLEGLRSKLQSPEGAREAFILSEIFAKKY